MSIIEFRQNMETPGIELGTSHMRSERSTTELRPPINHAYGYISLIPIIGPYSCIHIVIKIIISTILIANIYTLNLI